MVTDRKFTVINMKTDKKIVVQWADAILETKNHKNQKIKKWVKH